MSTSKSSKRDRFVALVEQHQAGLRAFVRALGARPEWVDDLAQEALLRAYRQFDGFDGEAGDFGRWVRGFARNLLMNEMKTTARRSRILHERVSQIMLAQHGAAVEEQAAALETAEASRRRIAALRVCMDKLPAESRAIVQRRYAEGANASQIAAESGSSAESLRQSLVRIRRALRSCIEQQSRGATP